MHQQRSTSFIKQIYTWPYFPMVVLGMIIFGLHFLMKSGHGDDISFSQTFSAVDFDPIAYSVSRYLSWTSRTLLEFMLMLGLGLPKVFWMLTDTVLFVLAGVFISKLLVKDENRYRINVIIACVMLLYPYVHMSTAGWVTTTIIYIWPLAFGLIALYPLRKIADGKKIRGYEYILYSLLLAVASNMEQLCVILLVVYISFAVYMIVKKQIKGYVFIQLAICLLNLIYMAICPGNAMRLAAETQSWLPAFAGFSLFQKVQVGAFATIKNLFADGGWLIQILAFLMFMLVRKNHRRLLYRAVAAVPLVFITAISAFFSMLQNGSPIYNSLSEVVRSGLNGSPVFIIFLLLGGLCISGCVVASVFLLGNKKDSLMVLGILAAGIASKMMMGFSPTVWDSGNRTGLFMLFSIIACIAYLLNRWDYRDKGATQLMLTISLLLGVSGFVMNYMAVYAAFLV